MLSIVMTDGSATEAFVLSPILRQEIIEDVWNLLEGFLCDLNKSHLGNLIENGIVVHAANFLGLGCWVSRKCAPRFGGA